MRELNLPARRESDDSMVEEAGARAGRREANRASIPAPNQDLELGEMITLPTTSSATHSFCFKIITKF